VRGLLHLTRQPVLDRSQQRSLAPCFVQHRFDQICRCGFSVRAGHSGQLQLCFRMSQKIRCHSTQRSPAFFHYRPSTHSAWLFLRSISDDRHCSRFNCILDVSISVRRSALHRYKTITAFHTPRIILNTRDLSFPFKGCRCHAAHDFSELHHLIHSKCATIVSFSTQYWVV